MSDEKPIENPRSKVVELEKELKEIKKFCSDLIDALLAAEKKEKIVLLPEGTYFGKRIE